MRAMMGKTMHPFCGKHCCYVYQGSKRNKRTATKMIRQKERRDWKRDQDKQGVEAEEK